VTVDLPRAQKERFFPAKPQNEKGPTFVGPRWGIVYAIGPIPTIPGGWGLRNPEPKGPGQRTLLYRNLGGQAVGGSGAVL
jgi:hypothetical protein